MCEVGSDVDIWNIYSYRLYVYKASDAGISSLVIKHTEREHELIEVKNNVIVNYLNWGFQLPDTMASKDWVT